MSQIQVLLVDDDAIERELATLTLHAAGIDVIPTSDLVEAERTARLLLTRASVCPLLSVVLIDIRLPNQFNPDLEGSVLCAALSGLMRQKEIYPVWLVGYTNALTVEREDEARYAGAHHVISKPLTTKKAAWIADLSAAHPPIAMQLEPHQQRYQRKCIEMLSMLQRAQLPTVYTAEQIQLVLSAITPYHVPNADPQVQTSLLATLGGADQARRLLRIWETSQPETDVLRHVLHHLLNGTKGSDISKKIAYDRTTVFRALQRLPARIAESFHLEMERTM